jgi:acetyl esterase
MSVHPQVAALLERVARSPLPPYHTVSPFVARRIYRDTRAVLSSVAPLVAESKLLIFDRIAVRAYRPVSGEVLPALVYFHGGGWTIGDLDTHDVLCRQLAIGARCAVFSVDYRLAPESPFPAAVEDCLAATRFVFEKSGSLKIDVSRIAVGGDSAGGNLAAVVALHRQMPLAFQLLIYPATDQCCDTESHRRNAAGYLLTREGIEFFRRCYLPEKKHWADWRASPLLAASHADLPPAFVITAGYDPLLDEGRAYAERLANAAVEVAYREYSDMVHGFLLFGGVLDTAGTAVADCCAALRGAFEKVPA